ncbi:hypothetical protein EMIHUDRAFT_198017 [Emiliania huxleyi CCMP1516]|uniref:Mitochondrial import inner membrane translocase subunit TIM16 n=2 Tax=Emiliania huxleyi TaxID=2903 RepID=A0A0D3IE48_EMIH1|nr:hypothetical protein EMIHUDRAFT_198017 [Emiliania huxleyi CCMP1516]EOD09533.1 hypothetical protein EMIHUDRAFT_198017 [Emiliania huxleyi CCMP1516]|eukprot:XP_005761962.1 hypothetical protein EMIHUDRAFT_198017 [Emiliania huxleyi CCMP1516]
MRRGLLATTRLPRPTALALAPRRVGLPRLASPAFLPVRHGSGGVGAPIIRLLANLVMAGSGVVGRAFLEAYQQALKDGGQAASRGSGRAAGSAAAQAEARQILNVGGKASEEEVREVAEKMIAMNDPAKGNTKTAADASERLRGTSHPTFLGGSEYLQQKITFARDILARTPPPEDAKAGAEEKGGQGEKK